MRHIRILRAQQIEDGVSGLAGKLAGLEYELRTMRKDRMRKPLAAACNGLCSNVRAVAKGPCAFISHPR
eukprot:4405704-Pleurochrysis_carterae.AAC.1